MTRSQSRPLWGLLMAIAITTTMDAMGLGMFSALPLLPLAGLFWFLQGFNRQEVGLTLGAGKDYGWAVLYPVFVVGGLAAAALATGRADLSQMDWAAAGKKAALIGGTTVIMTILTEEGFFRGWLWASLTRAFGAGRLVLVVSTLGFTLWHLSAITLMEEFSVPASQVPIFLVNATMLGLVWGLLRQVSGSLVVAAVSHGVWNGATYTLFGFGTKAGALGVGHEGVWGPETGYLGLLANAAFVLLIIRRYAARHRTWRA